MRREAQPVAGHDQPFPDQVLDRLGHVAAPHQDPAGAEDVAAVVAQAVGPVGPRRRPAAVAGLEQPQAGENVFQVLAQPRVQAAAVLLQPRVEPGLERMPENLAVNHLGAGLNRVGARLVGAEHRRGTHAHVVGERPVFGC